MTPADSFADAFIDRCMQDGLTPEQAVARIKLAFQKTALLDRTLAAITSGAKDLTTTFGRPLLFGAIAAPPLLGAAAGYGMARISDRNAPTTEEVKNRELLDTLYEEAGRLDDIRKRREQTEKALSKSPSRRLTA